MKNLPDITERRLTIKESPNSIRSFDFILQFLQLEEFQTNQQFPNSLDLAEKMFKKTKGRLFYFCFKVGSEIAKIMKWPKNIFFTKLLTI